MMNEPIQEITAMFLKLSASDQDRITTTLTEHFGKPIKISDKGLTLLNLKELELIRSTISGLIMTREYLPEMGDYEIRYYLKMDGEIL